MYIITCFENVNSPFGNGLPMAYIPQSQLMKYSSLVLTALLTPRRSGRQRLKASIGSFCLVAGAGQDTNSRQPVGERNTV
jgi:hypothetical protein